MNRCISAPADGSTGSPIGNGSRAGTISASRNASVEAAIREFTDGAADMGIAALFVTSNDDEEILACLRLLERSTAGIGYMRGGFDMNNPSDFSREWFAWTNSLFTELLLKLKTDRPALLQKKCADNFA